MNLKIPRRGRVAVVRFFGVIGTTQRSSQVVPILERLRRDRAIRAIILDIDSPGGEVTTSAYLHTAVLRLAEEKPVIAFVRGACASGAYLAACGASQIVALPYSIIGSIGVISVWPVISDLMEQLGVKMEVSKSGALKDQHAYWRPPTDEERQQSQALVDEFHEQFVALVSRARGLAPTAVQALATGEVFWATRACEQGLVDELGDFERAVELAMQLGKVPRRLTYVSPRRRGWLRWVERLAVMLVEDISAQLGEQLRPRIWL